MPIRPENRSRYPRNWKHLSRRIRHERARAQCECRGECGSPRCIATCPWMLRCTAVNYQPHPVTGSKVVLTVAHLDHTPEHCDEANLRAWCQLCHLAYDRTIHESNRIRARLAAETAGMTPLFDGGELQPD